MSSRRIPAQTVAFPPDLEFVDIDIKYRRPRPLMAICIAFAALMVWWAVLSFVFGAFAAGVLFTAVAIVVGRGTLLRCWT